MTATQTAETTDGSTNLPATTGKKKPAIVAFNEYMDARMDGVRAALPDHITPERFQRVVLTALQRKPELLKCTPQSLWNACLLAAQDGLLPDGREGAIVPYGENAEGKKQADVATWMPMVEGLRKKARNSGEIVDWRVEIVRDGDLFDFELGDEPYIKHKPRMSVAGAPQQVVAAYSIVTLKDGTKTREVMSVAEINQIRSKSRAKNGPWGDPIFFPEMCRKTVARRHYKQLPHSSDLDKFILDDDARFGLDRPEDQIAARQERRALTINSALDQFAGATPPADNLSDPIDTGTEADAGDAPVADAAKPRTEAKPETSKSDAAKAKPPVKDEDRPAEQQSEKSKDDVGHDTVGMDLGPADTLPDNIMDDPGIDHDANRWEPGQPPTTADQYESHFAYQMERATTYDEVTKAFTADAGLRTTIGITEEQKKGYAARAKARREELKAQ